MRRVLFVSVVVSLLVAGCLPDLGAWQIVPATGRDSGIVGGDGGVVPRDGGPPLQPNPIDYGTPCPSPHLVLVSLASSSETARLLRVDPSTGGYCRNVPLLELQRDFGAYMYVVTNDSEAGLLVGVSRGLMRLDAEGFPSWRYQPTGSNEFNAMAIAPYGSGGAGRLAVLWQGSGGSDQILLLDKQGHRTNPADVDPPYSTTFMTRAPDGTGRVLMATNYGGVLAFTLNDTTMDVEVMDGVDIFGTTPDYNSMFGTRQALQGDPTLGLLTMTHANGVLRWRAGDPAPNAAFTCPAHCGTFQNAAAGANSDIFAICTSAASASERHLVRLTASTCTLLIDGTSLGTHTLSALDLVHTAL